MMIWSIVSTLAAKCGTLVIIFPHSSTFPTKKSRPSSFPSLVSLRITEDFSLNDALALSLSSESSSERFEIEETFLRGEGGTWGLGSTNALILF